MIAWLRRRLERDSKKSPIGDDAAYLRLGGEWAITTDSQIEGTHFFPGLDPALVARRLLAVNLSDLAASGADPAWAFLALGLAPGYDVRRFFVSFVEAAKKAGVTLAGGDLARHPSGFSAHLTLLGRRPKGGRWLRRSTARPGDFLYLGGTVGESALGHRLLGRGATVTARGRSGRPQGLPDLRLSAALDRAARRAIQRHLEPRPQLRLGLALGRRTRAAAIDVSDGLARDLHRLCRESGVGATIAAEALPLAPDFASLCRAVGEEPLALALSGGEDYVLLFSLPPRSAPPENLGCTKIGEITSGADVRLSIEGKTSRLPASGWDHLR